MPKHKSSSFIVVSFAITDIDLSVLKNSLDRFGIDHDIRRLNEKEAAKINYSQALFLKTVLKKYAPRTVVWMDPNSILNRYPIQFDAQCTDVAVHVDDKAGTMSAAVVYLANTKKAFQILDYWIAKNVIVSENSERSNLRLALIEWQRNHCGRLGLLPESYINGEVCGPCLKKTQSS